MISEKKKKIVIENYFKSECNINTTIHDAYVKGFERGLSKAPQPERKTGRWICVHGDNVGKCDQCGSTGMAWMNFCPICGSDNREAEHDS